MSARKNVAAALGILWWAVQDRWHLSRLNPWGAGSPHTSDARTRALIEQLERQGPALLRAATQTDPQPPQPPVQ